MRFNSEASATGLPAKFRQSPAPATEVSLHYQHIADVPSDATRRARVGRFGRQPPKPACRVTDLGANDRRRETGTGPDVIPR